MKSILLSIALLSGLSATCQEDYIIHLDDTSLSVALDRQYSLTVKGKRVNFKIAQKDTLTYAVDMYSFQHLKGFKVSTSKVEDGVEQISLMTAEGSGLLIQNYETMNPTTLNEMMLNEVTKESISYGYKSTRTDYKKVLRSGHEIEVTKAVLRYKDEVNIYEVASIGKKDAGIMIVTMRMDDNDNSEGLKLIDLMWRSMKLNW